MVRQGAFGFAAIVSALTCACTSASNDSPPTFVDKPPLTGDATGFTYELSEKEKRYNCRKLTGVMQVRIQQMRGKNGRPKTSLASRGIHAVNKSVYGETAGRVDPEEQYTRDHAMLEAYNHRLATKNCKTFDIAAELRADESTKGVPTPTAGEDAPLENKTRP